MIGIDWKVVDSAILSTSHPRVEELPVARLVSEGLGVDAFEVWHRITELMTGDEQVLPVIEGPGGYTFRRYAVYHHRL